MRMSRILGEGGLRERSSAAGLEGSQAALKVMQRAWRAYPAPSYLTDSALVIFTSLVSW